MIQKDLSRYYTTYVRITTTHCIVRCIVEFDQMHIYLFTRHAALLCSMIRVIHAVVQCTPNNRDTDSACKSACTQVMEGLSWMCL